MATRAWQGSARAAWVGLLLAGCAFGGDTSDPAEGPEYQLPWLPGGRGDDAEWDLGGDGWDIERVDPGGSDPTVEPPPPEEPGHEDERVCRNGLDDDGDGLVDCEELACLGEPTCCREVEAAWAPAPESCLGEAGCGWATFAPTGSAPAVRVEGGAVVMSGPGPGEAGLRSAATLGLTGEPVATFVASAACVEGASCRPSLGVALTGQESLSPATGVVPEAGIVLDGELGVVRLYVGGRLDRAVPSSRAALAAERGYALRVEADGHVAFWVDLDPAELSGPGAPSVAPTYRSSARVDLRQPALRLAGWSRLDGGSNATLRGLRVDRRLCPAPGAWTRVAPGPVLSPATATGGMARPAVARDLDGSGLVAVFEQAGVLEVATSEDGRVWTSTGPAITDPPPTAYGLVARRAPALLRGQDGAAPALHLYFEAVAEVGPDAPAGLRPTAIAHAVSTDGRTWVERPEDAIALEGVTIETAPDLPRWRWTVGQPTVVRDSDGSVAMWFVGRDPASGESALGLARSADGSSWEVEPVPASFDSLERLPFERDGRAEPQVVLRGSVLHMWYVGLDGARESIGYAVSSDGLHWDRFGPALDAAEPWEGHGVTGPAVLVEPLADLATDQVSLYYVAGPRGREAMGLAVQETPAP